MPATLDSVPRLSPRTYHRVCQLALFALAFIVVTGAGVRLTGSGLGCSDWPTCEQNELVAPLDNFNAMVEFVNRAITGLVSIVIILAVLGSLLRRPLRHDLVWWSLGLVGGLIAQIVLGGLTVKFELSPPFVMAHFALSMVLLWNAVVLEHRAGEADGPAVAIVAAMVRRLGRALFVLAAIVLFTGTVVTGSGPHGGDERVRRLPFYIPEVARIHGLFVIALLATTVVTLWLLQRNGAPRSVNRRGQVLVGAIVIQALIGYTQYFTGVPPGLALLHVVGATVVWIAVLRFHLGLWTRAEVVDGGG
ncbi:MAG: heme A synthase [Actinobacteria bacterium]|nr:heme A synthase [Actinomycetota bacterium]